EIAGDLQATILSELRESKIKPGRRTIGDFHRYVAIKSYSACADYFREKHQHRRRLKDMLRHHLQQSDRFALWRTESRLWLCGLRSWAGQEFTHQSNFSPSLKDAEFDLFT